MPRKPIAPDPPASPARREPRQARALHKVELILEAAMRLLNEGSELTSLTTNAVAERAGVSIGTLYQYFDDREAILDALARREVQGMAAKTLRHLNAMEPACAGERIRQVLGVVLGAYGGRARVHRLLLEYGLSRGTATRLDPLYAGIANLLASAGVAGADGKPRSLAPADAFVLTYAMAGVMRAYVARGAQPLTRQEVEDALVRLAVRFLRLEDSEPARPAGAVSRKRSHPARRSTPG